MGKILSQSRPSDSSADEIVEALAKCRLVTEAQLAKIREFVGANRVSGTELADALVEREALTQWQADRLLAGNTAFYLGRYKFLGPIGQGAHGVVFRAQHSLMRRTVAVKILSRARLTHRNARARFRREVQAMARLDHPNIVAAYDAGQVRGTQFLVMEFVDGLDLRLWSEYHNQIDIDWACEFTRQAALGLQHAHEQGMVHRDVKPANILVAWDQAQRHPAVKILDLGLARILEQDDDAVEGDRTEISAIDSVDAELTQVGAVVGTPDYLAPEQILRDSPVDERTDIYGLGCTFFKLLTGRVPFEAETLKKKILTRLGADAAPPPLRSLVPGADARLEAIVNKMLRRDPDARYSSAAEVADRLASYAERFSRPWEEVCPRVWDSRRARDSASGEYSTDDRLEDFLNEMGADASWSIPQGEGSDESSASGESVAAAKPSSPKIELPPLRPVPKTLAPSASSGPLRLPQAPPPAGTPGWVYALAGIVLVGVIVAVILAIVM